MRTETMDDAGVRSARDARRKAILDIAREVFLQEGFAAASMSSIATRLGGSKGTLYNYFRSKEELFAAIIETECQEHGLPIFESLQGGGGLRKTLSEFGSRFLSFVLSEQVMALHRLVIAESVRFPELGRLFFEAGPQRGRALLAAHLDQAMASGELRRGEAGFAAEHFLDLCFSGLYRRRLWNVAPPPSTETVDRAIAEAVDLFLRAYAPA